MGIILASFGMLIIGVFIITGIALLLHYLSSRYGVSLLLMYVATVVGILTYANTLNIFLEPLPGFILTLPSDIFVPTILVVILVLYVIDSTEVAQVVIFGIALIQLLVSIIFIVISLTAYIPTASVGLANIQITDVLQVNLQVMIAGVIAFIFDMFVITVVYQGIYNSFDRQRMWLAVGMALLVALWTDAIIFNFLSALGRGGFTEFLPGDIFSKSISAVVIFPFVALYLYRFAPRIPPKKSLAFRTTFDIFHNLFGNWQLKISILEAELRENQINMNKIIRHIHEVFWTAEKGDDQSYFLSPAFESMIGIKRSDYYLTPEIIDNLIHEDDKDKVKGRWLKYTLDSHDIEFRIRHPNGDIHWIRDRTYLIKDDNLNLNRVIGISEDITAQKERQALQTAIEVEREKIRFLHDLIRDVSHDIQSPINAISLKVDLLRRVKGDQTQEKKYLNELKKQTSHLSQLVEHLFTLIKVESQIESPKEICSFNDICQDVFDALYPLAVEKNIAMTIKLTTMPSLVQCNTTDLRRAVINLIGNAIRYTPKHGKIWVKTQAKDDVIEFSVEDTGIGINEQDLPHIFDRFYRASNTNKIEGTGLGLAITQQIVQNEGGTITVSSQLKEGIKFVVQLPKSAEK